MVPLLTARADHVHAPDEAIGYEAAGGAAVYRGEWKVAASLPPYGDRKWRLYNLRDDPNEARDMSSAEPELARAMPSDFGAYVARNGIIEVPADYDVIRQARANAGAASTGADRPGYPPYTFPLLPHSTNSPLSQGVPMRAKGTDQIARQPPTAAQLVQLTGPPAIEKRSHGLCRPCLKLGGPPDGLLRKTDHAFLLFCAVLSALCGCGQWYSLRRHLSKI